MGRRLIRFQLRTDGFDLRLRFWLRTVIKLFGLFDLSPGKQPPPGLQQWFRALLHHRVYGAANHLFQGDRPRSLREFFCPGCRRHGRTFRLAFCLRFCFRLRTFFQSGRAFAGNRRVLCFLDGSLQLRLLHHLFHILHDLLLPAVSVFRQNFFQGEFLCQRWNIRQRHIIFGFFIVSRHP